MFFSSLYVHEVEKPIVCTFAVGNKAKELFFHLSIFKVCLQILVHYLYI
jgi:hypothetical protein